MSSLALAELPYIKETASTALRQTITTHTFTLPLCLVIGSALWLLPEVGNILLWGGWFVAIVAALCYAELNTKESLLRKRSQMTSTVCFALLAVYPHSHHWNWHSMAPLLLLGSCYCLIQTAQTTRPEGYTFYSYALLSCAAAVLPQTLWLVPVLAWCQATSIGSLTLRSAMAALLGMCAPMAMLGLYLYVVKGATDLLPLVAQHLAPCFKPDLSYWMQLFNTSVEEWTVHDWQFASTAGCLLSISIVSISHYVHTALKDKLRVRTFFNMLMLMEVALWLTLLLFPAQADALLLLLSAISAPFVAHYFTLSQGWAANVVFGLSLSAFACLAIFNYNVQWILSLIFS